MLKAFRLTISPVAKAGALPLLMASNAARCFFVALAFTTNSPSDNMAGILSLVEVPGPDTAPAFRKAQQAAEDAAAHAKAGHELLKKLLDCAPELVEAGNGL